MSATVSDAPIAAHCHNCDTPLSGRFCFRCGQRDKPLDPSLHELLHEAVHEFAHLDGRVIATLRAMLKPGLLTAEFLAGRRTGYIGPVRLYLTLSVLFFLITAAAPQLPNRGLRFSHSETPSAKPAADNWFTRAALKAAQNPEQIQHAFVTNTSRAMFVLVPLFAAVLRLVYRRAGRRYPAFVYFSLHFHAFLFGAFALAGLADFTHSVSVANGAGTIAMLWCTVYLFLALRRVFGGSRGRTVLKMAATACLYFPCLLAGIGAAALVSMLTL